MYPKFMTFVCLACLTGVQVACHAQPVGSSSYVEVNQQRELSDELALTILARAEGIRATGGTGWGSAFELLARRHAKRGEWQQAFDLWNAVAQAPSECAFLVAAVRGVTNSTTHSTPGGDSLRNDDTSERFKTGFFRSLVDLPEVAECGQQRAEALSIAGSAVSDTDLILAAQLVGQAIVHATTSMNRADTAGLHDQLSRLYERQARWADALSQHDMATEASAQSDALLSAEQLSMMDRARQVRRVSLALRANSPDAPRQLATWSASVRDARSGLAWTERAAEVAALDGALRVTGQTNAAIDLSLDLLRQPEANNASSRDQAISLLSQLQGADTVGRPDAALFAYDLLLQWASPDARPALQSTRDAIATSMGRR